MALESKVISVPATTVSTSQTIAVGFAVKGAQFFFTTLAADAESMTAGTHGAGCGFSDGTNHRASVWAGDHNVGTSNVGRRYTNTQCITIITDGTPTTGVTATAAFSGTDIVLTWSSTPPNAYELVIVAFGGADITNVFVGHDTMPTATGNKSVTSVSFQGDMLFLLTGVTSSPTATTNSRLSWGCTAGSSGEVSHGIGVQDGQTMSSSVNANSVTASGDCIRGISQTNTVDFVAQFTQWTSNGFDLNFSTAPGTAWQFGFMVIKGGSWATGVSAKPSTATAQSISGLSFQPKVLGLGITAGVTSASTANPARTGFGAATATTEEGNIQLHHSDAINTTVQAQASSTKCLGISAVFADFTSFQSDGWTITWAQAGNAELVGWWAAGDTPAATGWAHLLSDSRNRLVQSNN